MIYWLMLALTCFALVLAPLVQAGTTSRHAVWDRQRASERVLEAHRIARWVASHPWDVLKELPDALGDAVSGPIGEGLVEQLALPEGEFAAAGGDALAGVEVSVALERDVQSCRHLHRILVRLAVPEGPVRRRGTAPTAVTVSRVVYAR